MPRRALVGGVAAVLLAPRGLRAQSTRRVARVGWLGWDGDTSGRPDAALQAFRKGLAALGWREGDNLLLEVRSGDREHASALVAALLRAGPEVLVAQGPMGLYAKPLAGAVPLVFCINGDPVEAGLVASLARPGGSVTGVTALSAELAAKRVELLKAARPPMTRVAVVANSRHPGLGSESAATAAAARQLGVQTRFFPLREAQELDGVLAAIAAEPFDGLLAYPDTLINRLARPLAEFNQRRRLPSISGWAEFARAGNLLAYGPNYDDFFALTAKYVDRILKGAKPADLPVEQPTRLEFVVNRRAAAAMGLVLPQPLLLRADEVIE